MYLKIQFLQSSVQSIKILPNNFWLCELSFFWVTNVIVGFFFFFCNSKTSRKKVRYALKVNSDFLQNHVTGISSEINFIGCRMENYCFLNSFNYIQYFSCFLEFSTYVFLISKGTYWNLFEASSEVHSPVGKYFS